MRCLVVLVSLTLIGLVGCSGGDSPSSPSTASSSGGGSDPAQSPQAQHPAALSATQFLNAVTQGDQQTALGRLTPLAAQRLSSTNQSFAFGSVDSAKFVVTQIAQADSEEPVVEFHMTASSGGQTEEFQLCCFMKRIENDWRLGGIAYDLGNGQAPVVVNYEAPPQQPNSTQPAPANADPTQTVRLNSGESEIPQTAHTPQPNAVR